MKSAQKFGLVVCGITSTFVSTAVITGTYIPVAQAYNPGFVSDPDNLVRNGDFEIDTLTDPNNPSFTNPNITDWTKTGTIPSDQLLTTISNSAQSGDQSLEFLGFQDLTFISQYVPTIAGKAYDLSYYLNVYAEPDALDNQFQTFIAGDKVFDQTNLLYQNYTKYDFSFLATSASTEIKFGTKANYGSFNLDTVVVKPTAVPTPSSIGGIVVAGLWVVWMKRKQLVSDLKPN
jgi:hypothetical protein